MFWEAIGALPPVPEARTASFSSSAPAEDNNNLYEYQIHDIMTTKPSPPTPAAPAPQPRPTSAPQPDVQKNMTETSPDSIPSAMSPTFKPESSSGPPQARSSSPPSPSQADVDDEVVETTILDTMLPATPPAAEGDVPLPSPVPPLMRRQMTNAAQANEGSTFLELLAFWEAMGQLPPVNEAASAPTVSSPLPSEDSPISTAGPSSSAPPQTMSGVLMPPTAETAALLTLSPTKKPMAVPKPSPATDDNLALQSTATCLAPATPELQSPRAAAPETPAQLHPRSRVVMTFMRGLFGRCVRFLAAAGGIVVGLASALLLPIPSATDASKEAKRSGC